MVVGVLVEINPSFNGEGVGRVQVWGVGDFYVIIYSIVAKGLANDARGVGGAVVGAGEVGVGEVVIVTVAWPPADSVGGGSDTVRVGFASGARVVNA